MAERDPRIDPQPGDVVRTMWGLECTVTRREGGHVWWTIDIGSGQGHAEDNSLSAWNDPTDTILYTSPTPSAPQPVSPDVQTEPSGEGQAVPTPKAIGSDWAIALNVIAALLEDGDDIHALQAGRALLQRVRP